MREGQSPSYRVLSRYELREQYGGISRDRPAFEIDPAQVPPALGPVIGLPEKWGVVEDDWRPLDILRHVPRPELEDLVGTASLYLSDDLEDPLTTWLAGPEAQENFTGTCLAFSELQVVFENAEWLLDHWEELHHEKAGDV
jgi:hypothetical protein